MSESTGKPPWPTDARGFPTPVPIPDEPPMPPPREITFDDLQKSAEAALDRMQTATEQLAAVSVRESSEDGDVTVEVNGKGELTGLWLDDAAMVRSGPELGELIVATASAALGKAFADVANVIESFNDPTATQ